MLAAAPMQSKGERPVTLSQACLQPADIGSKCKIEIRRARQMTTIYGIKSCDTMKKARAFLDQRGVKYTFHDYKSAGIERARLEGWVKKAGWESLLNKAGTTFRKLPDADKEGLTEGKALKLMLAQPSLIKRPVLELAGGKILVGFKPDAYAAVK